MIEIILLAGALSVGLEPYAVDDREPDTDGQRINTNAYGRPFQWTTRRSGPDNSPYSNNNDSASDGVQRDAFGRPVEVGD